MNWKNPIHILAFGFGSGLAPKAPGTFGTLLAIPIYLLCQPLPLSVYLLVVLLTGGNALHDGVSEILDIMADRPFIFNLGHGILPETPPEHVAQVVDRVRAARV